MHTTGEAIPLFDGVAPGSESWERAEQEFNPFGGDCPMLRNVVRPTLTPVLPEASQATGTGVVVFPGGGYSMLAMAHEGFAVAEWLAARGIAAFVVKYRVMETPGTDEEVMAAATAPGVDWLDRILRDMDDFADIPLADGRAALALVHTRAAVWGVRTDRIGAVGFSAGGRLVLDLSTHPDVTVRPAFVGAVYTAPTPHPVGATAPPLFLAVAADDALIDASMKAHAEWRAAGRPVEAHYYARGGHGFGMNKLGLPADRWIEQLLEWMRTEGFVG